MREVTVFLFDQMHIAKVSFGTQISEVVFTAADRLDAACVVEQRASLTEQVERDVRQRNVFFDLGSSRGPLRQPLRQNERVVT